MVRLLAVKASIATLRRAISLSDRLKPATWELLAIFCAALFVLSVWGFTQSERQSTQPAGAALARRSITLQGHDRSIIAPHTTGFDLILNPDVNSQAVVFKRHVFPVGSTFAAYIDSSGSVPAYERVTAVDFLRFSRQRFELEGVSDREARIKPFLFTQALQRSALADIEMSTVDALFADQWGTVDIPGLVRSLRQTPAIIYQPAPEGYTSVKKELTSWATLLGLLLAPLTGLGMMLLALLGHHRKRGEYTLLHLQIIKINLENDNLSLVNRNLALTNEKIEIEVRGLQQEAGKSLIISV